MAGYTITKKTTIQNLNDAKKIYEKLNNADPKPSPQQKAQNDAAISHADKAIKHLEAVRKKYAQVYPDIPYLSSGKTLLSLEGVENALSAKSVTLDANDKAILDQVIGAEKPGWQATAVGIGRDVGKAIFTGKDGKFNTCKLEVAGVATAAAGLLVNKTVGSWMLSSALPWIGTAISAVWGFSPVTVIGLGVLAGAGLLRVSKKLLGPLINKVKQQRAYNAEMKKANEEAEKIGNEIVEPHDVTKNLFQQRLTKISTQFSDPAKKADAQQDLFRVLMEIRDAGPSVLNETEKQELINFVKTDNAFAGITQTGNGMKEKFNKSKSITEKAGSDFNNKLNNVKDKIKKLDVKSPKTVAAVEAAISDFESLSLSGKQSTAAKQLQQLLVAQFKAELEYAKARNLDKGKVQAAHNANAKDLDIETQMNI